MVVRVSCSASENLEKMDTLLSHREPCSAPRDLTLYQHLEAAVLTPRWALVVAAMAQLVVALVS